MLLILVIVSYWIVAFGTSWYDLHWNKFVIVEQQYHTIVKGSFVCLGLTHAALSLMLFMCHAKWYLQYDISYAKLVHLVLLAIVALPLVIFLVLLALFLDGVVSFTIAWIVLPASLYFAIGLLFAALVMIRDAANLCGIRPFNFDLGSTIQFVLQGCCC